MSIDFNWPKKGDKALISAAEGAYFHIPSIRMFYPPHATSFKQAAEIVLDKIETDGNKPSNDIFVFPVMYLYRHGIEIILKSIIKVGVGLDFFRKEDVDVQCHNLAKL